MWKGNDFRMVDTVQQVVGELVGELEARFPYAAALLSGASGVQINDNGNEQNASEVNPNRGIVFTVYDGANFVEYATSHLAPDALARDVRAWAAALALRPDGAPIAADGDAAPGSTAQAAPQSFATETKVDPASVPLPQKLALLREIVHRAQGLDQRIVQVQTQYGDVTSERLYIGRGRVLEQRVTRTTLAVFIAVSDGEQVRYNLLIHGGTGGFELTRVTGEDLAHTTEIAVRLLKARKIEPGTYDVVTDPSVSGVIAHECFGHGVELDLFPKGRARAAEYIDERVAAPGVQMFDDPGVAGAYGSYFFDDEGELARPTQILRDGILVRPISDFASATFAPGIHTANGRRQDFTRKVYARMSNTFFASGDADPAAMLAGIERGIYLRRAESGMEDPMGWGIQVTAHYGEEIVNGRLTGKLYAPVGITGYVPELLSSISAIGNDFALDPGTCGKGHKEFVPVASGGPHLRMKARLG